MRQSSAKPRSIWLMPAGEALQRLLGPSWVARWVGIDLRALAALRVGLATMILLDLFNRGFYLAAHYTDQGVMPRAALPPSFAQLRLSLYDLNGSLAWAGALFAVTAIAALMLLVGYRTRLATITCWVLVLSLQQRNPMLNNSGDLILRLLLFWAMFLPLGARWALDRRARGVRHRERLLQSDPTGKQLANIATVAILAQLLMVYVFTAQLKTHAIWNQQATAVHYTLQLDIFTTAIGDWVAQFDGLLRLLTRATIGLEVWGPLLLLTPVATTWCRTAGVILFVGFHVGLILTMTLGLFPWICIVGWLMFLPPAVWDRVEAGLNRPRLRPWREQISRAVGSLAQRAGRLGRGLRPAPVRLRLTWFGQAAVGACLLMVLHYNLTTVTGISRIPALAKPAQTLGIDQVWDMFASYPRRNDGWYVIPATLANGDRVDLWRGGPVRWERPASMAETYPSVRWRKHLGLIWRDNDFTHVKHFARWVRRDWNRRHPPAEHVVAQRVVYVLEYSQPPGHAPIRKRCPMYRWRRDGPAEVLDKPRMPPEGAEW